MGFVAGLPQWRDEALLASLGAAGARSREDRKRSGHAQAAAHVHLALLRPASEVPGTQGSRRRQLHEGLGGGKRLGLARHTVYAAKRLIGRKWTHPVVEAARVDLPYELVEGEGSDVRIKLRDRVYPMPEISAMVLTEMKRVAEEHGGQLLASNREGGGARFVLRLPLGEDGSRP